MKDHKVRVNLWICNRILKEGKKKSLDEEEKCFSSYIERLIKEDVMV